MINLNRLEGFYRVAKAGGYARAVSTFGYPITQPAVHQQVRKLEQELGQRLLRRTAKDRMATTPAGQHLYNFCAPFFERLPEVEGEVSSGGMQAVLRVDAGPQEIKYLVAPWLRKLRMLEPGLCVELRETGAVDVERLRTGATDVIIEHFPKPPAYVAQKLLLRAYGMWVVPEGLAPKGRVKLEALGGIPFVGFHGGSRELDLQRRGLEHHGLRPSRLLGASTVDAILGFVQAGLGYSLIAWPDRIGPKLPGVVARRVRVPQAVFPITASWLRRASSPSLRAALEAMSRVP